jgi:parvulin-like peptidyl-prolyl isomerase
MFKPGTRNVAFSVLLAACCMMAKAGQAPAAPAGLEDIPEVVATVNGNNITRDELIRELVGSSSSEALDRLVQRTLIEQAAKEMGVTVTKEDIEQQFKVDKRNLHNELISMPWDKTKEFPIEDIIRARFRMSLEEYKAVVIRQRLLTMRCLLKDADPTEAQLLKFFQDRNDLFQPPTMYRASHILITPFDPADLNKGLRFRSRYGQMAAIKQDRVNSINLARDHKIDLTGEMAANDPAFKALKLKNPDLQLGAPELEENFPHRRLAEQLLQKIKSGALTWDQALKKHTQDPLDKPYRDRSTGRLMPPEREMQKMPPGDVGWFSKDGPVVPDFYNGVKNMKVGEIAGPVATYYGFHLVKMMDIKEPKQVSFEQVRDKVRELFIDEIIQRRAEEWLKDLSEKAVLKSERTLLWPPAPNDKNAAKDPNPPAGSINGYALKRSDVWRELLRSDGDEALDRLIHFKIVMTMLKQYGVDRLDWETAGMEHRAPNPPRSKPIAISAEAVDLELNGDRLRLEKEAPDMSMKDYIYYRWGQSLEEYKQKIEAGLIVRHAIKSKVPIDDQTLLTQFALSREFYKESAWYEISHILIVPNGGMDSADSNAHLQAKLIIDQIYRLYVANPTKENFEKLVTEYSMDEAMNKNSGGRLPNCFPESRNIDFPEGPAIYREISAQKLERGQASSPVKTVRGYHIVRIDNVHPETPAEFNNVKSRIEKDYLNERAKMYTDVWLRALNNQAKVTKHLFGDGDAIQRGMPPDNFPVPGRDK